MAGSEMALTKSELLQYTEYRSKLPDSLVIGQGTGPQSSNR